MEETYIGKLIEYFIKNWSKGYTTDSLKIALERQGYSKTAINRALEKANNKLAQKAPVIKEKPKIKYHLVDDKNKEIEVKPKKKFWKRFFR